MVTDAIVCVGETLFDVLPAGECIGGAPFNVAAHLAQLGATARLISRIGNDARGHEARRQALALGIDLTHLQTDPVLPTGIARVALDAEGAAQYTFPYPCAWDALEATSAGFEAVRSARALVHGTLAQRDARARQSVRRLCAGARWRIYDPNLRAPHIDAEVALQGLHGAQLVKLNAAECAAFAGWIGCRQDPAAVQRALAAGFGVEALCITRGTEGSRLYWQGHWYAQGANAQPLGDTIGAGDAFLALLVQELLTGAAPEQALQRAARLGAFVASRIGAVPTYAAADFRR